MTTRHSFIFLNKKQYRMNNKLEEALQETQFERDLITAILKFVPKHFKEALDDSTVDYKKYGSETEVKIKLIQNHFSNLYTVLRDLDFTIIFLKKKRELILAHYPEFEEHKKYYNYHFENYYIRLVTLSDIIGRLGNLIYELNIDSKKSSAYVFKDKAKKEGYSVISNHTNRLIEKLEILKEERHKKLHTGEADIEAFENVVFWEDLNKIIGADTEPVLKEYTDKKVLEEVEKLQEKTLEIVYIIRDFLEEANHKLKDIASKLI